MYLRDLMAGLRRRWYVVIAGLLLTAYGTWTVFSMVPLTYQARASVMLMPPDDTTPEGGNPFLNLSGMAPARDVLTRRVDADIVRLPIEDAFPDVEYVIYADSTTSGPMILAEVRDPDEAETMQVLDRLRTELRDELEQMQADLGVPAAARIQLTEVAVDQQAEEDASTRLQLTVAAAGVGTVLTVLLAGFIDGLVLARRARRAHAQSAAGDVHGANGPGPDAGDADPTPDSNPLESRDGALSR